MKAYIAVDMEGISGVIISEQLLHGRLFYQEARRQLVNDTNAVIAGALEAGTDDVLVIDAHASGFNFIYEELHPAADYIMGGAHQVRFPFLEDSDVMMLVGYHAMSGTANAVRDHTMSSANYQDVLINGLPAGEIMIDAALAGSHGVPVGLVTGDDKACGEARQLLGNIETAEVKQAIGRHAARMLSPARARELLQERARRAVERAGSLTPYMVSPPVTVRICYNSTDLVDRIYFDGNTCRKIDSRTVEYRGDDVLSALSAAKLVQPYSTAERSDT
ncbi:MAG: M55 family metallopeptidase [Chloroflexota bacterium]|nr:M55 family metallopeptidase [Chloroflexota bacterium]MDE2840451.1 M55 family metallopeptidase [Chloroflexota bacterium]